MPVIKTKGGYRIPGVAGVASKKKKQAPPKKKQTTPYADFQNKSAAAFDYLTTFNGDFDQAVEFLSALKPLVETGPPNKAS